MLDSKDFLAELEYEMASAGKLLDLVPEDKLEWRPHPRAMTLGALALHVATISGSYTSFASSGSTGLDTMVLHPEPKDKAEILSGFEQSIENSKELLKTGFDMWANEPWELTKDGKAVLTVPRYLMVRLLVFNHWYHHRGQLTTYLRILDLKLPSVYGPSADDDPFA